MMRRARVALLHDAIWVVIGLSAIVNTLMLWAGPHPPSSDAYLIASTITLVAVLLREARHQ